jgi:hypothetical protein
MTAKELIEVLQAFDPETRIFTKGYEGGLEDAGIKGPVTDIALNINSKWYYGPHEYLERTEVDNKPNLTIVKGIVL